MAYCPLSMSRERDKRSCSGYDCAWWSQKINGCVIFRIALALDEIADTIEGHGGADK